ncbi:MAG: hypothetical protein U9Q81_04855 [Pseudomonadota bacterium]|nr:hypothetical protein [Pseudomonadota bacterium]
MRKTFVTLLAVGLMMGVMASPAYARGNGNPHGQPTIYVTGQDLAYDSIALTAIPFVEGAPYQQLEAGGPTGLQTEFGPGDQGYVGGRWWLDNGDGIMDEDDAFFMCPLLGPGFHP